MLVGTVIIIGKPFVEDVLRADSTGFFAIVTALGVGGAIGIAAVIHYLLCETFLFHRTARWKNIAEWSLYALVVVAIGTIDYGMTRWLIDDQFAPMAAKAIATVLLPVLNFAGRRFLVFPSPRRGPWGPGQKLILDD